MVANSKVRAITGKRNAILATRITIVRVRITRRAYILIDRQKVIKKARRKNPAEII